MSRPVEAKVQTPARGIPQDSHPLPKTLSTSRNQEPPQPSPSPLLAKPPFRLPTLPTGQSPNAKRALEIKKQADAHYIKEDFSKASVLYLEALRADPTNQDLLLALGTTYYGLGKFDGATIAYSAYIQKNPRDALARQLRLESHGKLLASLKPIQANGTEDQKKEIAPILAKLDYEMQADQAMIMALISAKAGDSLKEIASAVAHLKGASLEQRQAVVADFSQQAQLCLDLAQTPFPNPKDAKFVRESLNQVAAGLYGLLAKFTQEDPEASLQKLSQLFLAYRNLAEGKIEEAETKLKTIRKEGLASLGKGDLAKGQEQFLQILAEASRLREEEKFEEAKQIQESLPPGLDQAYHVLRNLENDRLRLANLKALGIWETITVEEEAIKIDSAKSLIGIVTGKKSKLGEIKKQTALEKELITEVGKMIQKGEALTIRGAVEIIAAVGPEKFQARAKEIKADFGKLGNKDGLLLPQVITYASVIPPSAEATERLLYQAQELEAREFRRLTPAAIYTFIQAHAKEDHLKSRAKGFLEGINREKGIADYAGALIKNTTAFDLLMDILILKGAILAGAAVELSVASKLAHLGIHGRKAILLEKSARAYTIGTTLWAIGTGVSALNNDLEKVFDPKTMAMTYGASLIAIGGIEFGMYGGRIAGLRLARRFGMVAEDGVQLSAGGKALSWAVGHTTGLGSMVGTTQFNQAAGLVLEPEHGFNFWESTVHDVYTYLKYAIATKGVDMAMARFHKPSHASHQQIAVLQSQHMAEAQMAELGYRPVRRFDGVPIYADNVAVVQPSLNVVNRPNPQALFQQLVYAPLSHPGFNPAKMVKFITKGGRAQAEKYAAQAGLKLEFDGNRLVDVRGMTLHEQVGMEEPNIRLKPKLAKLGRWATEVNLNMIMLLMGGGMGEGGSGGGKGKGPGYYPNGSPKTITPGTKNPRFPEANVLKKMAERAKTDPSALKVLVVIARDGNEYAIKELAKLAADKNPEAAKALEEIPEWEIKSLRAARRPLPTEAEANILKKIGERAKTDPSALKVLVIIARDGNKYAIGELAKLAADSPEAKAVLEEHFQKDGDHYRPKEVQEPEVWVKGHPQETQPPSKPSVNKRPAVLAREQLFTLFDKFELLDIIGGPKVESWIREIKAACKPEITTQEVRKIYGILHRVLKSQPLKIKQAVFKKVIGGGMTEETALYLMGSIEQKFLEIQLAKDGSDFVVKPGKAPDKVDFMFALDWYNRWVDEFEAATAKQKKGEMLTSNDKFSLKIERDIAADRAEYLRTNYKFHPRYRAAELSGSPAAEYLLRTNYKFHPRYSAAGLPESSSRPKTKKAGDAKIWHRDQASLEQFVRLLAENAIPYSAILAIARVVGAPSGPKEGLTLREKVQHIRRIIRDEVDPIYQTSVLGELVQELATMGKFEEAIDILQGERWSNQEFYPKNSQLWHVDEIMARTHLVMALAEAGKIEGDRGLFKQMTLFPDKAARESGWGFVSDFLLAQGREKDGVSLVLKLRREHGRYHIPKEEVEYFAKIMNDSLRRKGTSLVEVKAKLSWDSLEEPPPDSEPPSSKN